MSISQSFSIPWLVTLLGWLDMQRTDKVNLFRGNSSKKKYVQLIIMRFDLNSPADLMSLYLMTISLAGVHATIYVGCAIF